jgi:hypothetical protein
MPWDLKTLNDGTSACGYFQVLCLALTLFFLCRTHGTGHCGPNGVLAAWSTRCGSPTKSIQHWFFPHWLVKSLRASWLLTPGLPGPTEISANFVNTAHVGNALRACTAGRPRSSFFVTAHWLRSKESEAAIALKKDLKDVCTPTQCLQLAFGFPNKI